MARGATQWSIGSERHAIDLLPQYRGDRINDGFIPNIILNRPDPSAPLQSGRTVISYTAWDVEGSGASLGPASFLEIDGQLAGGRLLDVTRRKGELTRVRWLFAPRLRPGRHVILAVIHGGGRLAANAWILTVR